MNVPDYGPILDGVLGVVGTACPWVAPGLTTDSQPAPYRGPRPWGLLRAPRLSLAQRESGTLGNRAGTPDTLVLHYLEAAYQADAARVAEERRVYDSYRLVAQALLDPSLAIPGVDYVWDVSCESLPDGPYIDMRGLGVWIGAMFLIRLETRA